MEVKQLLKKLNIRKEVCQDTIDNFYYFVGRENSMISIEQKLESCPEVKRVFREYFTDGFGRLCFELK